MCKQTGPAKKQKTTFFWIAVSLIQNIEKSMQEKNQVIYIVWILRKPNSLSMSHEQTPRSELKAVCKANNQMQGTDPPLYNQSFLNFCKGNTL